jgi:hypothetical protein
MALANRHDDFFKDFVHNIADLPFEILILFRRSSILNPQDKLVHLTVNAEECLKNLLCNLLVFKQGFLCHPTRSSIRCSFEPPFSLAAALVSVLSVAP